MNQKIIAILVMTLVITTIAPAAQSTTTKELVEQPSSIGLDITIPDTDIRVDPPGPWEIGTDLDIMFSVENQGAVEIFDLNLDVNLCLVGAQGPNRNKWFGQPVAENVKFRLLPGEKKFFRYEHKVHTLRFEYSQTCLFINVSKDGEWVEGWENYYVQNKVEPDDVFLKVIPFVNPWDKITEIRFYLDYFEGFPEEWDVELAFDSISEDLFEGGVYENIITIHHNNFLEQGTFGQVRVFLNAVIPGQDDEVYIGDVVFKAVADDIEPTLEVGHPSNGIYFRGSKILPYLQPVIIGSGFVGELQVFDDTFNFVRVFMDGKLICLDTASDHPHFELPAGPIIGRKSITIEAYDEALNMARQDLNVLIFKLS